MQASNPMLFPLRILPSIASVPVEPGEKTAKQMVHHPPIGALPSIPGHVLSTPYDSSPSSENGAPAAVYEQHNSTPQHTPYSFYAPVVNGPLRLQSPSASTSGSPQTSPWALSSPESSSTMANYTNSNPSALPFMSPSSDSILFEPGVSHVQPTVDNYTKMLQSVGQFPLESMQDRLDDDPSETSSLEEDDPMRYVNWGLLSHIAVRLRDKVPRGTHVKGSIPYPRAFTGKDIVVSSHLTTGRHKASLNDCYSPQYIFKYNGSSSCISAVQLRIVAQRYMLRVVFKANYSFMRSSGMAEHYRMGSKTSLCSWMIKKETTLR